MNISKHENKKQLSLFVSIKTKMYTEKKVYNGNKIIDRRRNDKKGTYDRRVAVEGGGEL